MQFGILGPLTVSVDGRQISPGPLKQQLVLALLLCRANTVTSVDLLTEALWGDEPPRTARKNLQVYVACLRKLLAGHLAGDETGERLVHRNGGYLLRVHPAELDRLRFEELVVAARQSDAGSTAALLSHALSLARGSMLDGLADHPVLRGEVDRFTRKWLAIFEDWAEAELAVGNASAAVERICEVAAEHPFRERLRQIQMTALHLSGRQSEALGVFDELRQSLARELGLRPSPSLERLYRSVLSGEPMLKVGRLQQLATAEPVRSGPLVALPPSLVDFTGRDEPLADAVALLGDARTCVVVLSGPVGAGKTSLSVQLAHQLAGSFPDGQIFLRLRNDQDQTRPCSSLLRELLRLAGVNAQSSDIDELAAAWQGWLLGRRLLLVLDGAVDAATVRALLPAAGASKVLITSRSRLTELDFADRLELVPMQPDEAVALLGRIVSAERVLTDPTSAAAIVQAVGLMPLAVRTAGNKLSRLRHLPLAEFAARLVDPDGMLDELCTGDGVLRGRLASSVADLSEAEQDALHRLGARANPWFTLDEAAAILDEGPGRVRRLLESLIEANAVTAPNAEVMAHAVVYELPPLLRCFIRELG
jgi:DNA-binding SARP family transcriptional activator